MPLYSYKKVYYSRKKAILGVISYVSLTVGSLFLFWSFYPVISFEIYNRIFENQKFFSAVSNSNTTALSNANSTRGNSNIFSTNLSDYTKAGIWFPTLKQNPDEPIVVAKNIKQYALSIPRLNITNAKVIVGGEDLKKGLVHYIPRSIPGEVGNISIFGHSSLPQLYNVKDYSTIFTYLPSLKRGDKVYVAYDDATYEYDVDETFIVTPEEVSILDQKYDDSYLTLVTCVPPGTAWSRYVVRAKLAKI